MAKIWFELIDIFYYIFIPDICKLLSSMYYTCTHLGTIQATLRVDNPPDCLLEFLLEKQLEESEKEMAKTYLAEKYKDGILPQISDIYRVTKPKQSL
jgi:hypothetical protein